MTPVEITEELVLKAIATVIEEINLELADDAQLGTDRDSPLFGEETGLDSLDLVRIVVRLEQQINTDTGRVISIADDKAMSDANSYFRTVGTLLDLVMRLLEEDDGAS